MKQHVGTIGPSVLIRGELSTTDALTIEGQVEGKIELRHNVLTIGPSARIEADVVAKVVNVSGKVEGDITAIEAINILETATVNGALSAPCVGIEEGGLLPWRGRHQPQYPAPEGDEAAKTTEATRALPQTTGR